MRKALVVAAVAAVAIAAAAVLAQGSTNGTPESALQDGALSAELVAQGLEFPTSMRFLDEDNILVLQKGGEVKLVSKGHIHNITQFDVANGAEQGLLGIAVVAGDPADVYIYFTKNATGGEELRHRLYKYSYDRDNRALANETMILDLPGEPGPYHSGGKIAIGPDGMLYAAIGDTNAGGGVLDNEAGGRGPDDKSVVFRVDRETGEAAEGNPFSDGRLQRYYAYGIRNSFGMDFDPVTGKLWMTENGPDRYDEVNIVDPGFNSGWHKVYGPMARSNATASDLVVFDGAHYADPAFSWQYPVGVTDIEFFDSKMLGEKYENNVFVGDINYGNLYFFELDKERDGFKLEGELADLVSDPVGDDPHDLSALTVGKFDGRITDIETGPDGRLYVLTFLDGRIYRIS
ncbi:MAG TPA: PQQ-dependent sugar dehydrogenase [Nitrososphaera sp.]